MADIGSRSHPSRYLAEVYTPRRELDQLETKADRIRVATEVVAAGGVSIRHLQVIFVPEEETCFHLFDAPNAESVEQVLRGAAVEAERISAAFEPETPLRRGNAGER